jgi:heptosyltransferase-1
MRTPEKILIIRLSSLGDILHAMPAFNSLRFAFPDARIDWLVEKKNSFLLSACRGIDKVIVLDTSPLRKSPWELSSWAPAWDLVRRLRARQYDFCIDFQGLLKTALISSLCGARMRVGFPKELIRERPAHWFYQFTPDPPHTPMHVVALNQLLAQSVGAPAAPTKIDLEVRSEDDASVRYLLEAEKIGNFAVINPGGGWPTKKWESSKYGKLAARIQVELGLAVVVTTGPGEEILFAELAKHCGSSSVHHFQLPFLQLIPLLRRARLLIGGDTGPFHLACALGTPVVGIFGPTDPVRNGPWRDGEESVFRLLPCSFCYGRTCPTQNECMDITVEEVFQAVVKRLARNS